MPDNKAITHADVRRAGMDLLARREHGRGELAGKLKRRFAKRELASGLIDEALDQLEADGLLDECRYAEVLLRQLLGKGIGQMRLRVELGQRGLNPKALAHIQPDIDQVDWFAQAEAVWAKKFGDDRALIGDYPTRQKALARRVRFMQYRGFRPEHFGHLIEALRAGDPDNEWSHDDYG